MNPEGSTLPLRESGSTSFKHPRYSEPTKFLPVLFILCIIGILYTIYTVYHCLILMDNPLSKTSGQIQLILFNGATALLVSCYIRCILVHPGTIPDDPSWEYAPQESQTASEVVSLQESKRSGDRRHCKWCSKYKPDRCHHCRVCRTCILRMDHHCPWIYNCVGFGNHKYFFLLLLYTTVVTHFIVWTMFPSLRHAVDSSTPFIRMFLLLFGWTLATFLAILVTAFFSFHIWLTCKAMTTIEFCEKSMKRTGYDTSIYDRSTLGNFQAVLGDNAFLWFLPVSPPTGTGLSFLTEETRLTKDSGRALKKKAHQTRDPGASGPRDKKTKNTSRHWLRTQLGTLR